jgi:Cu/Ag efflux pump CusA
MWSGGSQAAQKIPIGRWRRWLLPSDIRKYRYSLAAFELSIRDVLAAARASTGVRGAGFVESATERITLQTQGQALTAGELGEVTLAHHNGVTARMKDVALVADGPEPKSETRPSMVSRAS